MLWPPDPLRRSGEAGSPLRGDPRRASGGRARRSRLRRRTRSPTGRRAPPRRSAKLGSLARRRPVRRPREISGRSRGVCVPARDRKAGCERPASSLPSPEELGDGRAGERNRVSPQLADHWRAFAPQTPYVGCRDFRQPDVVAGPVVDTVGEPFELRPPARVIRGDAGRPHDEEVDVAASVTIASGGRAEDRSVRGRDLPLGDLGRAGAARARCECRRAVPALELRDALG